MLLPESVLLALPGPGGPGGGGPVTVVGPVVLPEGLPPTPGPLLLPLACVTGFSYCVLRFT